MFRAAAAAVILLSGAACSQSRPPTEPAPPHEPADGVVVPTRFEAGRFIAAPVVAGSGEALSLLVDTGGNDVLFTEVVDRLGLATVKRTSASGEERTEAVLPVFTPGSAIPPPLEREGRLLVLDRFPWMPEGDGVLGPGWFGGRVWLLDYPGRRLVLDPASQPPPDAVRVPLGFADGLWFPSVTVDVGGEPLALLFDTGAHTRLVDGAVAALADGGPAVRATSFAAASLFDRWREAHPDWRLLEDAEERSGAPMIEVPSVRLGGVELGPVWFTRRPDAAFHEHMSRWTDVRVDGALGGNALRDLRLRLDYPAGLMLLEKGAGRR